jgi:hypothetical protein
MKTISLSVSEEDYESFRKVAEAEGRSVALMIREAMAAYRVQVLEQRKPLRSLPVLAGHRQIAPLPTRDEIYTEIHAKR